MATKTRSYSAERVSGPYIVRNIPKHDSSASAEYPRSSLAVTIVTALRWLRVSSGEELREKILERDYKSWIELQSSLIDQAWLDWRNHYYFPFRKQLA